MEYPHERAVADGVNCDYEVYRIRTSITAAGSIIEAAPGTMVGYRDRQTRKMRWEAPDEDVHYTAADLDRNVVATDQIRLIVQTFRDKVLKETFPDRTESVPKTLIFAKDDSHAEDIVKIVREEFGKGNEFCQKITYKVTSAKPADLIQSFRNSYNPRIVVTVDLIATGRGSVLAASVAGLPAYSGGPMRAQLGRRGRGGGRQAGGRRAPLRHPGPQAERGPHFPKSRRGEGVGARAPVSATPISWGVAVSAFVERRRQWGEPLAKSRPPRTPGLRDLVEPP